MPALALLSFASTTVDLPGAQVGDFVEPQYTRSTPNTVMDAKVLTAGVVTVTLFSGLALLAGSGTLKVRITRW